MMRGVWTVARRELRGYFDQPTAYVLIVAFLGRLHGDHHAVGLVPDHVDMEI